MAGGPAEKPLRGAEARIEPGLEPRLRLCNRPWLPLLRSRRSNRTQQYRPPTTRDREEGAAVPPYVYDAAAIAALRLASIWSMAAATASKVSMVEAGRAC